MDREKLIESFGQQLVSLGFFRGNALDNRISAYILNGGELNGRPNYRTEIDVDFYGWKIVYYPRPHCHYVQSRPWQEVANDANEGIEMFLQSYYL